MSTLSRQFVDEGKDKCKFTVPRGLLKGPHQGPDERMFVARGPRGYHLRGTS